MERQPAGFALCGTGEPAGPPAAGPSAGPNEECREANQGRVAAEAETSCGARAEGERPVILEA